MRATAEIAAQIATHGCNLLVAQPRMSARSGATGNRTRSAAQCEWRPARAAIRANTRLPRRDFLPRCKWRRARFSTDQAVLFQFAIESGAADAEQVSRHVAVALGVFQSLADGALFHLRQRNDT